MCHTFINRMGFILLGIDVYESKMHIAVHLTQTPLSSTEV